MCPDIYYVNILFKMLYILEKPVKVEVIGQIQQFKDIKESTMVSEIGMTP